MKFDLSHLTPGLSQPPPTVVDTEMRRLITRVPHAVTKKASRQPHRDLSPNTLSAAQIKAWRLSCQLSVVRARTLLGMSKNGYYELERRGSDNKRTILALRAISHGLQALRAHPYELENL